MLAVAVEVTDAGAVHAGQQVAREGQGWFVVRAGPPLRVSRQAHVDRHVTADAYGLTRCHHLGDPLSITGTSPVVTHVVEPVTVPWWLRDNGSGDMGVTPSL